MGNATLTDLMSINTTLTMTNSIFDFLKEAQLSYETLKMELGIGIKSHVIITTCYLPYKVYRNILNWFKNLLQQFVKEIMEITFKMVMLLYLAVTIYSNMTLGYSVEVDALRGKMRKNEKMVKNLADKIMYLKYIYKII